MGSKPKGCHFEARQEEVKKQKGKEGKNEKGGRMWQVEENERERGEG